MVRITVEWDDNGLLLSDEFGMADGLPIPQVGDIVQTHRLRNHGKLKQQWEDNLLVIQRWFLGFSFDKDGTADGCEVLLRVKPVDDHGNIIKS